MRHFVLVVFASLDFTGIMAQQLYLGADLSYVNELEDCGAQYYHNGEQVDPFELFAEKGANLIRVRLWHNPEWTDYSDFDDVVKTIRRAKEYGMKVLLDIHYSDTWADPHKQYIPKAWAGIKDVDVLADSVLRYTYNTLNNLAGIHLLPEIVQVGNEINAEILQDSATMNTKTIHWERNLQLINSGLAAVNRVAEEQEREIQTMIHIAQPENAFWWFEQAFSHGIKDFDWIGLSYYPKWSSYNFNKFGNAVDSLKGLFGKRIMVVETAYPYSLKNVDQAGNVLGADALIPGYPATPRGQLDYLLQLTRQTLAGGGEGVIYWEPAWVTSSCSTLWGQGSHWENATLFDAFNNNEALPAFKFYDAQQYKLPAACPEGAVK